MLSNCVVYLMNFFWCIIVCDRSPVVNESVEYTMYVVLVSDNRKVFHCLLYVMVS